MPSNSKKSVPLLPMMTMLTALVGLGGLVALAARFYRSPRETMTDLIRAALRLVGIREEICNLNGVAMRYYCAGRRGRPMILIHGLGGTAENWAALLPLLSRDFLVYAPDLPGFGRTPLAPEGVNIATHILYLRRFLDALGYPRAILVGNSLGGWIAASFAAAYPERVEHLFLLNSAGLRREQIHSPYAADRAAARRSIEHMMGRALPVPKFILDDMVRNSQLPAYKRFIEEYDAREELDEKLAQISVPTTIIWGEQDRLLPLTCAYDLHEGIPGSELVLLARAGHVTQVQAPTQVARIIQSAIAQQPAGVH